MESLKLQMAPIYDGCKLAIQGEIWNRSLEWKTPDERILNIDCGIYPIMGPEESVEGIILVLHDFTESKLLNEAKEYDKLKTEFFANISHDFRTPLSVIHAAIQLLQLSAKGTDIDKLRNSIDKSSLTIRQNINRLTKLIDNIIDVSKADTGFLQLSLKNCNIIHIIEEATMSVVDLASNKGIAVEFDTDTEEKIMACDEEKMERIILNLLSNSVKFTGNGGRIFVKVKEGLEYITIIVKDTGIGIPEDKQQMVFERFRQADKKSIRNHEGSGIGLSLVKSLVELHGGSISVQSKPGCGTEFTILLPVVRLKEAADSSDGEMFSTKKTEIEFSDII